MTDFNIRADSVNVEQIMEQIRARIRDKRGVDYTEQQIRELAAVKLEKFLDPRGVRSDLLEQFRKAQPAYAPPELPNYAFEEQTLYESTRPPLRLIRRLLNPILKLFFNPNPLIQALNIQSRLNTMYGEREARREATRRAFDQLQYELMHNLVIETTRMSIEVKNLKMRVESLASRLEFNERRARALESVVVYKPSDEEAAEARERPADRDSRPPARVEQRAGSFRDSQDRSDQSRPPAQGRVEPPAPAAAQGQPTTAGVPPAMPPRPGEGPGQRSRRRRRRRGRRGGGSAVSIMAGASTAQPIPGHAAGTPAPSESAAPSEPPDYSGADTSAGEDFAADGPDNASSDGPDDPGDPSGPSDQ
jgi:hypothetical protein